ncbi:oligosaccharide flippase family protein [uncultured Thiothrix sp.]|uniref:lipopolysaccharide biosynthesis protein n=1 Tax=uncultured Thiothrix sp. TaxID=223185 RepID=UPI00261E5A1D|nr:oligosaccharide flippase family protein [uncultured Thiothrix sp.]
MISTLRNYTQLIIAPFNRVHALFMGSSALVMLFPLISAPIVARLYTPEDFGIYAVFFALATILSAISSLELRNVALLESQRVDGAHGALLAISIVTLFSLSLFVVILLFPKAWLTLILGAYIVPYLIWLPISIFFMGTSQVLYTWAIREKEYKLLARNKLVLGLVTMLLQIGIGLMKPGPIGFITANLLGLLLSSFLLMFLFVQALRILKPSFGIRSAITQFRKHYRLTVWTMPGALLNSLSQFLPDLLINRFFGATLLGQYSLAVRMINLPFSFMATSIQDFFRQQASEEFNNCGHCRTSFWRFFALTSTGAVLFILPIILLVPYVFPVIFGSQWTEAGTLVQAVVLLTIVRFISSPLSYVWIIQGRQRLDFIWQIGLLAISLGTLLLPPFLIPEVSLYVTLWIYSLGTGAWYVLAITVSYLLSRHTANEEIERAI